MEKTCYAVHIQLHSHFKVLKATTKAEAMKEVQEFLKSKSAWDFIDTDNTFYQKLPL